MTPYDLKSQVSAAVAAGTTAQLAAAVATAVRGASVAEAEALLWSLNSVFCDLYPRLPPQQQLALLRLIDAVDLAVDGPFTTKEICHG